MPPSQPALVDAPAPPAKKPLVVFKGEVDIVSLAALLLSLSVTAASVFSWLRANRPDVVLYDDNRVLAVVEKGKDPRQPDVVHFLIHMSYYNRGGVGYDDVVKNERIVVLVSGKECPYEWTKNVSWDYNNNDPDRILKIINRDTLVPVLVGAGHMEQHEAYFAPAPRITGGGTDFFANAVVRADLVAAMRRREDIGVTIVWTSEHSGEHHKRFRLVYDDRLVDRLDDAGRGWQTFPLMSDASSGRQ